MNPALADMLGRLAQIPGAAERSGFLYGVEFAAPELFAAWLAHDAAEFERRHREDTQERLRRRYYAGPWLPVWWSPAYSITLADTAS